jgi:ADP-heptose:LPS heptosyltransferase
MYASANMMHNTDFASLNCLHKTLPDADKQFKLSTTLDDIVEVMEIIGSVPLNDLILVHPGVGWPTKTFPPEWWSKVINGLINNGQKVAVIGKNINESQGHVNIKLPEGVYDLRDTQSLGGLIGIISQAKTLITNDSAPVHLAGAFDNNIIVIPTCKHPDHILPLRHSQRYFKARALYRELMCDAFASLPTFIDAKFKTIDQIPGGDIHRFIPEPESVVAAAIEMGSQ